MEYRKETVTDEMTRTRTPVAVVVCSWVNELWPVGLFLGGGQMSMIRHQIKQNMSAIKLYGAMGRI